MADLWQEVKRLQADFQRAQLTSAKQKLSERNVVEIVNKLVELKLIEVIYTIDGKEYLTPDELAKEIKDEVMVHGGRINLVELQQILNVDFRHVENKVSDMIKHDQSLLVVLGQLITRSYLDNLAEEVNDRLQDQGHVTIAELTTVYDLPADFLSEHIHERMGKIIQGKVDTHDPDVLFTDAFITRMKSHIRGAFSAITRPTTVGTIISRYGFQDRLFFSILEELVSTGRLAGAVSGARQENAAYIPEVYTKTQNQWVDAFYKQNGYLEYDSLSRLGISDSKGFIKKRFKSEPLTYLSTCCAGVGIKEQIEASVEEALQDNSWVNIMPLLPSIFSEKDANQLLTECTKQYPSAVVSCDTIVSSQQFITGFAEPFKDIVTNRAEKESRNNPNVFKGTIDSQPGKKSSTRLSGMDDGTGREEKKDQRKKKAQGSTKSGGGTQGREVKTKSLKKKGARGRGDAHGDSDDDDTGGKGKQLESSFMSIEEMEDVLRKQTELRDCPVDFLTQIARHLHRPLTKQFHEQAKSIFLSQSGSGSGAIRKKTHGELQEKLSGLWTNCKLFEKGIILLPAEGQTPLIKHLLKTICSDIANMAINSFANDHMVSLPEETEITAEVRAKLISKMPEAVQPPLVKLHASLNGKSLEDFFTLLEKLCGPDNLGIILRKPDKRKERQLVFNHRQVLLEQMNEESDPAMALHLAVVLLFQTYTQCLIHAPGKSVPQVIVFLRDHVDAEQHKVLVTLQDLVVKHLKLQGDDKEEEKAKLTTEMQDLLPQVKDIASKAKKTTTQSETT
ncbi:E3 UFM1-protein ligase 1-like [Mizuhopecten yessoensis]|uniref:E3 UFM1-protein ligase 1 n=1 Tax=Mizuhopecten yessoensis TaxID=6573 RepID=A0A210QUX3_MIZYE|nr:E3 UFM1-protein ligase 1-like [Mizuhopecten yessoensis]OWF52506.1 E3 UFM1-protein ligase 1 [Mizuhopecten yessoensis]